MPADENDVTPAASTPAATKTAPSSRATAKATPKLASAPAPAPAPVPAPAPAPGTPSLGDLLAASRAGRGSENMPDVARERLGAVPQMRREGPVSGRLTPGVQGGDMPRTGPRELPALGGGALSVSRAGHPVVGSQLARQGESVVAPRVQNVQRPSTAELNNPYLGAQTAMKLADEYRNTVAGYEAGADEIRRKVTPRSAADTVDTSNMPALAKLQRERLQRVAELRASLREYGWKDEDIRPYGDLGKPTKQ